MHFPDLLFGLVEEKRLVRDALPPPIPVPLDDGQRPPPAQVDLGIGASTSVAGVEDIWTSAPSCRDISRQEFQLQISTHAQSNLHVRVVQG